MGQRIEVGDQAPAFTATTQTGQTVSLSDFLHQQAVVLFFYPKSGTSICTKEACAFRDAYEDFVQAGAAVIGVSSDGVAAQHTFTKEQRLPFTLISDAKGKLRTLFGVPKTLGLLPGRVTYVIDRQGIVRHLHNAAWQAGSHVSEALRVVGQLNADAIG